MIPGFDKKIRIKDIAIMANVSIGTVDRVLHERGEVSPETRQKVLRIVEQLNYEPNLIAKALSSKKRTVMSILIPQSSEESTFWKYPVRGIQKAYDEIRHYSTEVRTFYFDPYSEKSFKEKAKEVLESKPNGILFAPIFENASKAFVEECRKQEIPFIYLGSVPNEETEAPFIAQNAFKSGFLAAKLLNLGLSDDSKVFIINIFSEKENIQQLLKREQGFIDYFKKRHISVSRIHFNLSDDDEEAFNEKLKEFFKGYPIIKGIFVTDNKVHKIAKFLRVHNKQNIRLIGYDLIEPNVEEMQAGVIDFLLCQRPADQGYKAVMELFNNLVLKKNALSQFYMPIDIITKENLDFYDPNN